LTLIIGCETNKEKLYTADEAERKFLQICKEEYDWEVTTKLVENTFWIYLPFERNILQFEANRFSPETKCMVEYFKGYFIDKTFYFEYQITPLLKSERDKGYTTGFTEQASEEFQYLINVIYRVYFNAQEQPEFYAIVLADIANGVEIIYKIYGEDLKKAYNNAIASDDYSKRVVQEVKGGLEIIQDKTGRHLDYHVITFDQFLVEQINQRVRFELFDQGFKLCNAPEEKILKIISYCLGTYEFRGFSKVILKNLSSGNKTEASRETLGEIKEF